MDTGNIKGIILTGAFLIAVALGLAATAHMYALQHALTSCNESYNEIENTVIQQYIPSHIEEGETYRIGIFEKDAQGNYVSSEVKSKGVAKHG